MTKTIQSRKDGETVGSTIRLSRRLRDNLKIQAIRAGRSFNTHVVMVLESAAGEEFGDAPPAEEVTQKTSHPQAPDHVSG